MRFEEYGKENDKTIVMLHGAHFVHCFNKQYSLAEEYHIIVPHIMGFGYNTDQIFEEEKCIIELANFIKSLNERVYLIGFSLGAQLAFKLVSEYDELFVSAIIVSPWLIKEEPFLSNILELNLKQLKSLKNKFLCGLTGKINGLSPKQRDEFIMQMQNVREETVRNMVYNNITLDSVPEFSHISTPIIALAGVKEQSELTESVRRMSEMNVNCKFEIWDKAGHNIPQLSKRFNQLILETFK